MIAAALIDLLIDVLVQGPHSRHQATLPFCPGKAAAICRSIVLFAVARQVEWAELSGSQEPRGRDIVRRSQLASAPVLRFRRSSRCVDPRTWRSNHFHGCSGATRGSGGRSKGGFSVSHPPVLRSRSSVMGITTRAPRVPEAFHEILRLGRGRARSTSPVLCCLPTVNGQRACSPA